MKNERIIILVAAVFAVVSGIWYSSYAKYDELTFATDSKIYYDNIETVGSFNELLSREMIVNINTADAERLATLKGIGEKTAQEIIDYRNANGPFENIEDIKNVSGIGDKTFEKIKDYITIEGEEWIWLEEYSL